MPRNLSITIRLNEEERERFERLARERDLPVSLLIRQLVRKELGMSSHLTTNNPGADK